MQTDLTCPVRTDSVAPQGGAFKVPRSLQSLSGPVCNSVVNGIKSVVVAE